MDKWSFERYSETFTRQFARRRLILSTVVTACRKNNCYCAVKSSQNKAISNNPSTYRNTLKRLNISNSRRFVFRHMLAYITLQLPYHKYTSSALHKSSMIDITSNNRQTCVLCDLYTILFLFAVIRRLSRIYLLKAQTQSFLTRNAILALYTL